MKKANEQAGPVMSGYACDLYLKDPRPGVGQFLWRMAVGVALLLIFLTLTASIVKAADISSDDPPAVSVKDRAELRARAAQSLAEVTREYEAMKAAGRQPGRLLLREVYDLDGRKVGLEEYSDKPVAATKAAPKKIPCGVCGSACNCEDCACEDVKAGRVQVKANPPPVKVQPPKITPVNPNQRPVYAADGERSAFDQYQEAIAEVKRTGQPKTVTVTAGGLSASTYVGTDGALYGQILLDGGPPETLEQAWERAKKKGYTGPPPTWVPGTEPGVYVPPQASLRSAGVGQTNPTTRGTTAPVVVLPSTSSPVLIPTAPTYIPAPAVARRGGISFGLSGPFGGGFSAAAGGCASGG
ncbi:MAG TPA: hypothetical protein VEJ18_20480 [Planctomycetota bacterium]|nr:hypothetical protein [Planctomycetota bacterium]